MSEKAFGHTWFTKKMLLKNKKFWLTEPPFQNLKTCAMSSDCNAILSEEKSAANLVFVALYEMCLFSSTAPTAYNFSVIIVRVIEFIKRCLDIL